MVEVGLGPDSGTDSDVLSAEVRRREVTARTLSLAIGLLGIPGSAAAFFDRTHSLLWLVTAVASTAMCGGFFIGFTRLRRWVAPALVLLMLLEELLVVLRTPPNLENPTPFFTPVVVFVAAATMSRRGVVLTIAGAFTTLLLMSWSRVSRLEVVHGELEAAPIMLGLFMSTVAFVQSRNAERTLALQIERERLLKAARADARAAYARYELISKNTEDIVLAIDEEERITFASPSTERILGIPLEGLLGRSALAFFADEGRQSLSAMLRRVSDEVFEHVESKLTVGNGERRIFAVAGKRIPLNDEPTIVLSLRDVTEARKLALALAESRRLESLGRLAGAVAHDFNNLLTIVGTGAENALDNVGDASSVQRELEVILTSVEKSAALTRQLLTFGKRLSQPLVEVDVRRVIEGLLPLLKKALPSTIQLSLVLPAVPVRVLADATQLEQIVMNLVTNARDAMSEGGKLEVALDVVESVGTDGVRRPSAVLRVSDSGSGIPDETKERIFEPYFTTKPEGKGTGLGLSTVYGIVTRWGGTIELETQLGVGTTFVISAPLYAGAA